MIIDTIIDNAWYVLLWSFLASAVMTTILQGSQGLGLSRLSLAFLIGTIFTSRRSYANVLGFIIYALGGWAFAILYVFIFLITGHGSWWYGLLLGLAHAIILLVVILPLIPYVHPRMANDYDGPTLTQRLEPPGFIGLNYGYRTPLSVVAAQTAYGGVIGLCFQMGAMAIGVD
ncbi:MAG: hypothetical protein KKB37_09740 [Alphaproteobacteria bacterium]|nr:hypothetical protein [Alphaproteobacteria bacterium]